MNTRERAGAILSAAKMRMLEAEGITVVTRARLGAFERLYDASKIRETELDLQSRMAFVPCSTDAYAEFNASEERFLTACDDIDKVLLVLEEMNDD